jgi:hypothetical protein
MAALKAWEEYSPNPFCTSWPPVISESLVILKETDQLILVLEAKMSCYGSRQNKSLQCWYWRYVNGTTDFSKATNHLRTSTWCNCNRLSNLQQSPYFLNQLLTANPHLRPKPIPPSLHLSAFLNYAIQKPLSKCLTA